MKMITVKEMKALAAAGVSYMVTEAHREVFTGPRYQVEETETGLFNVLDWKKGKPVLLETLALRTDAMRRATER